MKRIPLSLALAIGLIALVAVGGPSSAVAVNCTSSNTSVKNLTAKGIGCGLARKVSNKYQSDPNCQGKPCSFRKGGVDWTCAAGAQTVCRGKKDGVKVNAKWTFGGGEH